MNPSSSIHHLSWASVSIWDHLETSSGTRVQVQVVDLEGDILKHQQGTGEEREPCSVYIEANQGGQPELNSAGDPWEPVLNTASVLTHPRSKGAGVFIHQLLL